MEWRSRLRNGRLRGNPSPPLRPSLWVTVRIQPPMSVPRVKPARNWAWGLSANTCRKTPPSLALLDVNLPDMEGYDIGKTLRSSARTRHIPIIFLTARGEKQDRIKGLGEGGGRSQQRSQEDFESSKCHFPARFIS